MAAVFLKILNMSITGIWIAFAVIILRLFLKKAPRALTVVLWGLVGIRLCCPFSFESILSLIPSVETVPPDIMYTDTPVIQSGVTILDSAVNPIISNSLTPNMGGSVNPIQVITYIASIIWITGIALMLIYTLISYIRIQRKVREAAFIKDNVWVCDNIDTPFIFGMICPKIYLPSTMNVQDMEYVIAHEKAHLRRRDHWWKPFGFLLLTIHWFNPVLWIAYVLLCKDIEIACDEKVIKEKGMESKRAYSEALINCSVSRRTITACPLTFGEVSVKERVKGVLNYKKPAFWIIIVGIIALVITALCLLTNPVRAKNAAYENAGQTTGVSELPKGFTVDKVKDALLEYINYRLWLYPSSLQNVPTGKEFNDYINKSIDVEIRVYESGSGNMVCGKTNIGEWLMVFKSRNGIVYCDGQVAKGEEGWPDNIENCAVIEKYSVTIPEPHKPNYGTSQRKDKMIAAFETYIKQALYDLYNNLGGEKQEDWDEVEVYMADFYEYESGAYAWFLKKDGSIASYPIYFIEVNGEFQVQSLTGYTMNSKDEFGEYGRFQFERDINDAVRHFVCNQE